MADYISAARSYHDFSGLAQLKAQAGRDRKGALRETAEQFEALFLQMMMKSMRDATPRSGLFDSEHTKTFESMYDREISLHMAKRGSAGIANMLVKQLGERQIPQNVNTNEVLKINSELRKDFELTKEKNFPINEKKVGIPLEKEDSNKSFELKRFNSDPTLKYKEIANE